MKIRYNSPFILSYTLLASLILLANSIFAHKLIPAFFVTPPQMNFNDPLAYFRLFSHALGHRDWTHLLGNFSIILLVGPTLEEKYGSQTLFLMALATAIFTGILNVTFFSTGLLGASGIAFMLILLGSFTNIRSGEIPLTFILIVVLYLAQELALVGVNDGVSRFAHILGGLFGAGFGFFFASRTTRDAKIGKAKA